MIRCLRLVTGYLKYFVKSKTKYRIHSPFVYSLITEVFEKKAETPEILAIRDIYARLRRSRRVLEVTDFGAGKGKKSYILRFRSVGQIIRKSSVTPEPGGLLYKLAARFQPAVILELGTSLGISTLCLSKGAPGARVITIEGCSTTSEIARENFSEAGISNVEMHTGRFEDILPGTLNDCGKVDFVFIDGHHEYGPTRMYVEMILGKARDETVIVIDDIHWSKGMEKAWEELCNFPAVTVSIDIYRFGILFLRKGLSKQHFIIRYRKP